MFNFKFKESTSNITFRNKSTLPSKHTNWGRKNVKKIPLSLGKILFYTQDEAKHDGLGTYAFLTHIIPTHVRMCFRTQQIKQTLVPLLSNAPLHTLVVLIFSLRSTEKLASRKSRRDRDRESTRTKVSWPKGSGSGGHNASNGVLC